MFKRYIGVLCLKDMLCNIGVLCLKDMLCKNRSIIYAVGIA